jgi:stage III sporulation protein AA
MVEAKSKTRVNTVLAYLPERIREEIVRLADSRRGGLGDVREIRLRRGGRSHIIIGRERLPLYSVLGDKETERLVGELCDGALYAHRDSIASGYLSLHGGIRVGLCGYARYEHRAFVGVSEMRSLLFRIPTDRCEFGEELYEVFMSGIGHGMLIYSPPGIGKTTALRSLARSIGTGRCSKRVAVIDERCEFDEDDYQNSEVDILKGYRRREGLEIATRTMSPELVMIDEIGGDDASGVAQVIKCGIPLIATAHAATLEELLSRRALFPLFECGAFDVFVGIGERMGGYTLSVDRK